MPKSQFIETNGLRLHCLEWGTAEPAVMILHGNGHCGGVYAPLAENLAGDFRVVTVDLRGHGLSDKPDSYTWQELRDDILGLIEHLDLRDILLLGHSRGGGVALLVAATAAERVRGVIVYEPSVPRLITNPDRMLEVATRTENRRSTFASRGEMYDHFRHRGAFKGWREEYVRAYVEHGSIDLEAGGVALASPPRVEAQLYRALVDWTAWEGLARCDVPVRVIFGEQSGRIRDGADPAGTIREVFPSTESKILPGCTHSGPMEQPELFEASVRAFAASHPR